VTIQREARDVYDARSKIVHGGELAAGEAQTNQENAERLLISALRTLFTERTDLIPDDDRARSLILNR
jgi:hypothetical protein